jgi:hypothetical protein
MSDRRRLLLLVAFLVGTALLALGVGYLVTGSLARAAVPAAKMWAVGAVVGILCHTTRAKLMFAGGTLALAGLFFLAPFIIPK